MPKVAQTVPSRTSGSFASVLASLTGRLHDDGWNDSALAEDITTISYEQALRASGFEQGARSATEPLTGRKTCSVSESQAANSELPRAASPRRSKSASVTIRLTAEEHAQLQDRAAAAQLSVSAYLRSCIFEAEALRSQVREALAQLRVSAASKPEPGHKIAPCMEHRPFQFFSRWARITGRR
jgi:hypothetical protein